MKRNRITKKLISAASSAIIAAVSVSSAVPVSNAADLDLDNYAKLLQYSLYFFDANYCGAGAGEKSHFSWRDDCHTEDVVPYGFHDAGDGIICGLTEGFSASTLGWMYYEYKKDFDKTGTTAHLKDITDEFARFFKASTTLDGSGNVTNFVYEIGDDGKDHGKWRAPELMDSRKSDETYSTTNGASNVAAQYAAALAQNYINFGDEDDLKYAKSLYDFAAKNRKMTNEQATYSDKSVEDDIAWAAGWMYLATEEKSYLEANSRDTSGTNDWTNDYYYGGVWLGAAIINAEITGNWTAPVNYIKGVVNANQNKFYVMNSWGSARHNTLMQTCALVATKHKDVSGADFSEWCKKQTNMILGDNNANVCLVVGYNDVSATSPHHRAASGLYVDDSWSQWNSWDGNYANVKDSHTLYGALCGGPTSEDFSTFRKLDAKDATSNEVALDYQVGLVGAAAGLFSLYQTGEVVAEIGEGVTVYPEEIAIANGETPTINEKCKLNISFYDKDSGNDTGVVFKIFDVSKDVCVAENVKSNTSVELDFDADAVYKLIITEQSKAYNAPDLSQTYSFEKAGETIEVRIPMTKWNAETTTEPNKLIYGDANCDEVVTMADAVAILQYLANSSKYPLSDLGLKQGDVDGEEGITAADALVIQEYDAGVTLTLPRTKEIHLQGIQRNYKADNNLPELKTGEARIVITDWDTGKLISQDEIESAEYFSMTTNIGYKNPNVSGGWMYTGPVYGIEENPQSCDLAKLMDADLFEVRLSNIPDGYFLPEIGTHIYKNENKSLDIVFELKKSE